MGDYRGSYAEEVKHVVNEDHGDWSWMHNAHTDDNTTNAAEEGEYYYEGEYINYEADYSYSSESSHPLPREGATTSGYGHRRVRSASGAHTDSFLENDQTTSQSSEMDDHAKVKTGNPNRKKGLSHTHADPVYVDNNHETPAYARNNSINLVSKSWLHDTSLREPEAEAPQHAPAPPATRPPPRRRPPGLDMVARSASLPNPNVLGHYGHYETFPIDVQYNGTTLPCDPAGSGYPCCPEAQYEDNQLAVYDPPLGLAPGSVYRLEEKPLDKALKFMRIGAVGFANVSKTAAVGLKQRSIEFKNLAIPVMKPILNAVIEEGKEQLMGPDRGRGRAYPLQRPNCKFTPKSF